MGRKKRKIDPESEPQKVPAYTCERCGLRVTFRPCVVCAARRGDGRRYFRDDRTNSDEHGIQLTSELQQREAEIDRTLRPDSPARRASTRSTVPREELESRLVLHDQVIAGVIAKVAGQVEPEAAQELRAAIQWLEQDRDRMLRDLFRQAYTQQTRPSERQSARRMKRGTRHG